MHAQKHLLYFTGLIQSIHTGKRHEIDANGRRLPASIHPLEVMLLALQHGEGLYGTLIGGTHDDYEDLLKQFGEDTFAWFYKGIEVLHESSLALSHQHFDLTQYPDQAEYAARGYYAELAQRSSFVRTKGYDRLTNLASLGRIMLILDWIEAGEALGCDMTAWRQELLSALLKGRSKQDSLQLARVHTLIRVFDNISETREYLLPLLGQKLPEAEQRHLKRQKQIAQELTALCKALEQHTQLYDRRLDLV